MIKNKTKITSAALVSLIVVWFQASSWDIPEFTSLLIEK